MSRKHNRASDEFANLPASDRAKVAADYLEDLDDDIPDGAAMAMAAEFGCFDDPSDLIAEMAADYDDDDDARPEPVRCPHCGKKTRGLGQHIAAKHPEVKQ